jgi:hypothetical protein
VANDERQTAELRVERSTAVISEKKRDLTIKKVATAGYDAVGHVESRVKGGYRYMNEGFRSVMGLTTKVKLRQ